MHTTYKAAIIQSTAYQILRENVTKALSKYNLHTPEWVILGHLQTHGDIRFVDLAKFMNVEPPHITVLVDNLEKKNLATRKNGLKDRRVKLISITQQGKELVPEVEKKLQLTMNNVLEGVTKEELIVYFRVLEKIIFNADHRVKGGENNL